MQIKHKLNTYIYAQSAESGPPLGTVLGNLGLNTINFCKDFNALTKDLPIYFLLRVEIIVYENRTFKFFLKSPPLGSLISLLCFDRVIKVNGRKVIQNCITLRDVLQLAIWQFPKFPLSKSVPIILGTLKSFSLIVVF